MAVNKSARYTATLVTSDGTLTITLLPTVAPITVNNFIFLARHHFYNGVIFHRIVPNFVVQTGDPTGTGSGGPGYTFPNEPVSMPYTFGTVAMANSGINTNGSQFFIVTGRRISLPPEYTIFGRVTSGTSTLGKLNKTQVTDNPGSGELSYPVNPPVLKKVTIHESA
jgi:cyclophilin family peptidyl-prolyl cis-trans isomerase